MPETPPRRTLLAAGAIDAGLAVGALVAGGAVAVSIEVAARRAGEPWERRLEALGRRGRSLAESRGLRAMNRADAVGAALRQRGRRSPGMRVMGLRRVDARTGGAASARRTIAGALARGLWTAAIGRLVRRQMERSAAAAEQLKPRVEEARRAHPGDPQAQQQAITALYRGKGHPGCLPAIGLTLTGNYLPKLPALWTRRRQTLWDLVAGTVLVGDRGR